MKKISRDDALRSILTFASGLALAIHFGGCATAPPVDDGSGPNDNVVDPELRFLLEVADDDHVEGDPAAPNTIIEYGDFECSVCGEFFTDHRPAVISELVDTGRARLVFRHFPISSLHPNARLAAIASECAVDFFEYHDLLFQNQDALTRDDLIGYAEEVGLNTETFANCLDGGSKTPGIDEDFETGLQLGITGTPTFFVNENILIGDHPVEDFEALLD